MNEMQYQVDLMNAMNEKLKNDQKMMKMIIESSTSAFVYYNYDRDEARVMGDWENYFDFTLRRIGDLQRVIEYVDEEYRDEFLRCINLERQGLERAVATVRFTGSRKWVECEASMVYGAERKPADKVVRFKDVTAINDKNEELKYMAYYDGLTGLYNRNYFISCLTEFINKARKENREVAVIFVDIDDFKNINDGMGLIIGDEVVMNVGQFLSEFASDTVIVSHFTGDMYCLAVYDPCGQTSVEYIYSMIRNRTRQPFMTSDGREINIKITSGVAMYPDASENVLELINYAEIVMLRAKHDGKDSIQYFDTGLLSEFMGNLSIENKLRDAIYDMRFEMYFQPQYEAASGNLRGVEALIRWKDPDEGMIAPSQFIPLAEKNGTIVPIGQWVIEDSIRTYMQWKQDYNKPFILSINISAIQYRREDFVRNLIDTIEKYGMNPSDLELEITETALIDNYKDVTEKLKILRDYGIRISMDDFGTGYSSLSYLKSLPIDTLKIDKTFVDTVLEDDNTNIIMESIMGMVKRLGLETVAEGVETQEQLDYLRSINCDNVQGFLTGRPQTVTDIKKLLNV
ncbi:MAG: bifunctional diguanylate cyclase/phosphodiesterase [Lachnospiraceae bacterium]|nr:bifunctional diguanylate cyclase/phosphodiesterase [Lachnospiraceae bacterium]